MRFERPPTRIFLCGIIASIRSGSVCISRSRAASEKLVASYPRMDVAEARPRVPSFYALELPRAIQGSLAGVEKVRGAEPGRRARAPQLARAAKTRVTRSTTRSTTWSCSHAQAVRAVSGRSQRSPGALAARALVQRGKARTGGKSDGLIYQRRTRAGRARRASPRGARLVAFGVAAIRGVPVSVRAARHLRTPSARESGGAGTNGSADARRIVSRRAVPSAG